MAITTTDENVVVYNVYSTLLTYNKSYAIVPDLASSWTLAPDNVTWTFDLVQDAYFLDPANPSDSSHSVTANDVVFSYDLQMAQPASGFHGRVTEIRSVTEIDAYTVQMVTRQPFAAMNATLATVPILPFYVWGSIVNPMNYRPLYPIGSGAMCYDYANSSATLTVLRRNPGYYGAANYGRVVQPDEVRFISYGSPESMTNDYLSGANSLDAIEGPSASDYTTRLAGWLPKWGVEQGFVGEVSTNVMTDSQRAVYIAQGNRSFLTGTNNQLLATNWTLRRAVAMSINRTALIADMLLGLGEPGDTLVPASNPWHYSEPASQQYAFDPVTARRMLNAAGWAYDANGALNPSATPLYQVGGTNPLIFRFYTLDGTEWKTGAQDIVGWLAQTGIATTDARGTPGFGAYSINQMNAYWLSADYDLWLWDWVFTPAADPSLEILSVETTMAIGSPSGSDNYYANATYDALYNESLVTVDPGARRDLTNAMQDMIYQYSSYVLPYYRFDLFAALAPFTPGLGASARWMNWGNWSQDPGLIPSNGLPNLWFQLKIPGGDTTPPTTSIDLGGTSGQNGWFASDVLVTLTATDDLSGIGFTSYSLDGGAFQYYYAPFVLSADGNHSVQYRSVDGAGNVESTKVAQVPIDRGPPVVQVGILGTQGNSGWYRSNVTVTLDATDAASGLASFTCRVDGGAWSAYNGPLSFSEGSHSVDYHAVDVAGNTASRTLTVKVDTTKPALTALQPSGVVTTSSVVISWGGADAISGIANYALSVDGGAYLDVGSNTSAVVSLTDGPHMITVRATDRAGNTAAQSTTVTVDTNVFSFTGPFRGVPTIAAIATAAAVVALVLWRRKRRPTVSVSQKEPPLLPNP